MRRQLLGCRRDFPLVDEICHLERSAFEEITRIIANLEDDKMGIYS